MIDKISEGDRVMVSWENIMSLTGVVEYIPQATGDSWCIRDERSGRVTYVQMFARMDKLEPKTGETT